jgi:uncharacterized protein YkwD
MVPAFAFAIALHSSTDRSADARALWHDLNVARQSAGLPPLVLDLRLCRVAEAHAYDMVRRHYFDHVSPDGLGPFERMTRAGLRYGYAGENIALDVDERGAAEHLYASPEHRQNMLEPHYTHVGIAAVATETREFFVEDFSDDG